MCDIYAYELSYAGRKFFAIRSRKHFNVYDYAAFAVGNAERGISNFSCLFTKDSAEQAFFGREFGLALGRNFTNENVAGANFCTDADNTFFVQIL